MPTFFETPFHLEGAVVQTDISSVAPGLAANEALRALSMAWSAYELYPNPRQQPAFRTALELLAQARDQIITFEVGAGRITSIDGDLRANEGSTGRLALRLFVHDVERLELIGAPTEEDLHALFSELALDEQQVVADGGIAGSLQRTGVDSIDVVQRGQLSALAEPWSFEGLASDDVVSVSGGLPDTSDAQPAVVLLVQAEASAESVAAAITTAGAGDLDRMAAVFVATYEMIHRIADTTEAGHKVDLQRMLAAYQRTHSGRSPLATFVEAFFLLPREAQARILEVFLEHIDQNLSRLLVDQFAGIDLVELSQLLSPVGYERLSAYIRDVVDNQDGIPEELLPLIRSANEVEGLRLGVSERVAAMLEGVEALPSTGSELRELLEAELRPGRAKATGLEVVRDLFECETRSDRFDRLVKSWTDVLVMLLKDGRVEQASRVLLQGQQVPEHSGRRLAAIEQGLAALTATNHELLLTMYRDQATSGSIIELVSSFGAAAVQRIVERLAVEESPATRRLLIALLVDLGTTHPQPIVDRLVDKRWYLVRNLVAVVAKLETIDRQSHLRALLHHNDDRVVIEALRALSVVDPDGTSPDVIAALEHAVGRVRETALIILRTNTSPSIDAEVHLAMLQRNLPHATVVRLAETLQRRNTVESRNALASLSQMRVLFRRRRAIVRHAVRDVLGHS